jgi:transcriptional regulator with XRE-family HTH domain
MKHFISMNEKISNANIGRNIKKIRLKHKLSQPKMCDILNKTTNWLNDREHGREYISVGDLIEIADILQEPGDVFFK